MVDTLVLASLSKSFGGVHAVRGLNLTVGAGEIVGLVGANGSGKTTTINMITGFVRPDEGSVRVGSVEVKPGNPRSAASAGIRRTFQTVRLFLSLTVAENVEVAALASSRRRRRRDVTNAVAEELEQLGLTSHASSLAGQLPYGLQRRVEFARALVTQPALVLLDEPGAGMNDPEIQQLGERIERVREERHTAFLLVEHHIPLVADVCDRLYVLDTGRLIAAGEPSTVLTEPAVKRSYMGHVEITEQGSQT